MFKVVWKFIAAYIIMHTFLTEEMISLYRLYDEVIYEYMKCKIQLYENMHRCNIVSLGGYCMPHTLPIQLGIKPTIS